MHRPNRSLLGELLGGVSLVSIIIAAIAWGGTLRAVEDHVDPEKHGLIVLAGTVETATKIVRIESDVEHTKREVTKNGEAIEAVSEKVNSVKSDLRLLIELNRRAINGPRAPAAAPPE